MFDYGRSARRWTLVDGSRIPPMRTAPARPSGCTRISRSASRATLSGAGMRSRPVSECFCALSWADVLAAPAASRRPAAGIDATRDSGETGWGGRASRDYRWRVPIERSALVIKGLTYLPTGATVAALTTSLPETPGGERNGDYRYTWMRDRTFTLQALHYLLLDWKADEFTQFVADLDPNQDGALQIMYGIDGRRDLDRVDPRRPVRLCRRATGEDRQRRVRPAPERRLRRGAGLVLPACPAQRAASGSAVADRPGPGSRRRCGMARARPGHLGGTRQAPALCVLQATRAGSPQATGSALAPSAATAEPLLAFELDRLFRTDRRPNDAVEPDMRAQAARIITTSFGHADMAAEDRAYLVRMVMIRTGLAQPDAERRVAEVIAQARRAIRRARANAVILAFMTAASLLAGATVAWYAAGFGGRHRDGEAMPAFWLNRPGVR